MTTPYTIQTILEFLIAGALIIGFFNESKIADFEKKIFNKIKRK